MASPHRDATRTLTQEFESHKVAQKLPANTQPLTQSGENSLLLRCSNEYFPIGANLQCLTETI